MSDVLAAALEYAARGWRCFPVNARKVPLTEHGFKDASGKPETLLELFDGLNGSVGVGVATGALSGLVVLDVDTPHGGVGSLDELESRHGSLPRTFTVLTGGGGRHFYFRYPAPPVEIRNSAGMLGAGLDVRGEGGYVVAPPSLHESGNLYNLIHDREVAELPGWLLELLTVAPRELEALEPRPDASDTAYGLAALAQAAEAIRAALVGQRHHTLNREVYGIGQLVGGGELTEATARQELSAAIDSLVAAHPDLVGHRAKHARGILDGYPSRPSSFEDGRAAPRRAPDPPIVQKAREAAEERQAEEATAEEETAEVADEVATVMDEPDEPDAPAWQPLPLPQAAAKAAASPRPEHGLGFVYGSGNTTLLSAEPGIGKSMVSGIFAAEESRAGRTTLYIDFERTAPMLDERLIGMGLTEAERNLVHYLRPQKPATPDEIRAMLAELEPSLVVLDAYDAALAAFGFETKNEDVRRFNAAVLEPLRTSGAAIVIPDHVTKNPGQRGRYSIGGQSKLAIVEAHIGVTAIAPLRRETGGKLKLHTLKDTIGWLPTSGVLHVRVADGLMSWNVTLDSEPGGEPGPFRPTVLMEKVSRLLEKLAEPPSRTHIEDSPDVKGKREYVRLAIDTLIEEGYAVEKSGPRNARLVVCLMPFRDTSGEDETEVGGELDGDVF